MSSSGPCLVSACLAGECCRYDAKANTDHRVAKLADQGLVVLVCPEVLGGLSVPRKPCELKGNRVIDSDGGDHTEAFQAGARAALELGRAAGCVVAVLKARSPSCGVGSIYDGTFSRRLIPGDGVFAGLLRREGFTVYSEENLPAAYDLFSESPAPGTENSGTEIQ